MNYEKLDIQVNLAFVNETLERVDALISSIKGIVGSFAIESLLVYLLQIAEELKLNSKHDFLKLKEKENILPSLPIKIPIEESNVKLLNFDNLSEFADLIQQVQEGLVNYEPEACDEGVNGTYFLKNKTGKYIGVFKPEDEESLSPNNFKSGTEKEDKLKSLTCLLPGEASKREVAAFLIDKEGFFGVPKTTLVSINHPKFNGSKIGSLQEFVVSDGPSWDIGPSIFETKQVHKIGILDLYIFNFDRHGGNILFNEKEGILIPIDNGFSLPDTMVIPNMWFEWMSWQQAKKPFDEETKEFIKRLDINHDILMLKEKLCIRDECLQVMKLSSLLLKKGVEAGLCLYDLGNIACRVEPDTPSALEEIYQRACIKIQNEPILLLENIYEAELNEIIVAKKSQKGK